MCAPSLARYSSSTETGSRCNTSGRERDEAAAAWAPRVWQNSEGSANLGRNGGSAGAAAKNKASVRQLSEAFVLSRFHGGDSLGWEAVASSLFLPPVAVPVCCQGRRHLRRKVCVFGRVFPADVHQRFFVVRLCDQHVERWNNK